MTQEELDRMAVVVTPAEESVDDVMMQVYMDCDHDDGYDGDLIEFDPKESKGPTKDTPCQTCATPCKAIERRDAIADLVTAGENLRGGDAFLASKDGIHFGMAGLLLIAGAEAHAKGLTLNCASLELSYYDKNGDTHKLSKFIVNDTPNR